MRVLGFDVETTGLDTSKDRIIEMGLALWDVPAKRPLVTVGLYLHDGSYPPIPPEITRLTGITDTDLSEFGTDPGKNFRWLENFCLQHKVDYIVAHNGENFDRPILYMELARNQVDAPTLRGLPWIDTRTDIPFPSEPDSRKLKHLALDCGFINPFAHRAVFDVLTMLRVLSNYDFDSVIAYSKIPFVTVRAVVSYDDRHLAKGQRYSWEKVGEKTYPKMWVKRIKADALEQEKKVCQFPVVELLESV